MSEVPQDAWNHFILTVTVFASWTLVLFYMGGKTIMWDYDAFKDEK